MIEISKCIFCDSKTETEFQNIFDTRFGIEKYWNIHQCTICGTEQTIPHPNPDELKKLYEKYYNFGGEKNTAYTKFREYFLSSSLYRFWLAIDGDISFHSQKGSGRLLDIGCNEGRGLNIYKRNGYSAEGLELNDLAADEARKKGFTVYTQSLNDFQPDQLYDIAVLSNVLEHSLNPNNMLDHVFRILKPAGQIWISCPNSRSWLRYLFGTYWINWHVPFHIVHFSHNTLSKLLQDNGFSLIKVSQKTPALWVAHSIISRLFVKRGVSTKQLRNPLLIATMVLVIRGVFFPFLWIGNRLGRGDCLVIKAKKEI